MNDTEPAHAGLGEADRTVFAAHWRIREEDAVARLAGHPGLAWTRLYPRSRVIQIVAWNGHYLGRVRLARHHEPADRWTAIPNSGRPAGPYPTVGAAAAALGARSDRRLGR